MSCACNAVSLQFACAPSSVWAIFVDRARYGEWYGYPRALEMTAVEPDFLLGGKVSFKGAGGISVITAFEPERRFALSNGTESNEFAITPCPGGCAVTLQTTLNGHLQWNGTEKARESANLEVLRRLRRVAGIDTPTGENEQAGSVVVERELPAAKRFFSSLALGYRNPLERHSAGNEGSVELARLIDNTEADVVIHRRAATVGIVLAIALIAAVLFSTSMPMSSVVPSSGLSVLESIDVDKSHAEQLYIGQRKADVELLLSCAGTRIEANEYSYSSPDGGEIIHVIYDPYGRVRSFAFANLRRCERTLELPIRELNSVISANMTVSQCEEVIGHSVSYFMVDKSGKMTLKFGKTELARGFFDTLPGSQLEITLGETSRSAYAQYYYAGEYSGDLPLTAEGDRLSRQYSNDSFYAYDRAAYYRVYMICGLSREQAQALLGTGGSESYADRRSVTVSYFGRNAASDEAQYRYRYDVTYNTDEIAQKVTLRNSSLYSKNNVLLAEDEYNITKGMTLAELERELQILPTWVEIDSQTLTLGYGSSQDDYVSRELRCELTVRLAAEDMTVESFSFK